MISDISPYDIINKNTYLSYVNDNYMTLRDIIDRKARFSFGCYNLLIDSLECLYKGLVLELKAINQEDKELDTAHINNNHSIKYYASIVNKYLPIAYSKEGYFRIIDRLCDINDFFTNHKYMDTNMFNDFLSDFYIFEAQRNKLLTALEQYILQSQINKNIQEIDIELE